MKGISESLAKSFKLIGLMQKDVSKTKGTSVAHVMTILNGREARAKCLLSQPAILVGIPLS